MELSEILDGGIENFSSRFTWSLLNRSCSLARIMQVILEMIFLDQYEELQEPLFHTNRPIITHKKMPHYVKEIPPPSKRPLDILVPMVWSMKSMKHAWKPKKSTVKKRRFKITMLILTNLLRFLFYKWQAWKFGEMKLLSDWIRMD